jgi:hypothetical protein
MLDGAPEIVSYGEHVAGEIGNCVACGVGLFALSTASQIFHVGHGAQQPIAHIGILGYERLELGARLRRWIGAERIGTGTGRLILWPGIGIFVGHWLS